MSSQLLIQLVRQQLEEDLLERVREAEQEYRRVYAISGSRSGPFERYNRLLGIFTELVVSVNPSWRLMLNTFLETAIDLAGADKGAILVPDRAPGSLRFEAQRGFEPSFVDSFAKCYEGTSACRMAFETSRRVVVEDITESPIFAGTPSLKVMLDSGLRALQSTPLVSRNGHTLGILCTHYCKATHLSAHELEMLDRVSSQTALFIEAYCAH